MCVGVTVWFGWGGVVFLSLCCIVLVRCVLVLRCGSAGVVWCPYPYVVLFWFDVCWCYGVVRLGWCGILMQAEALVLQPA